MTDERMLTEQRLVDAAVLVEALEVIAHIVSQANVNPVDGEDGFIARYDMPVGSIHRAIPFLNRHGWYVDIYGQISRPADRISSRAGDPE